MSSDMSSIPAVPKRLRLTVGGQYTPALTATASSTATTRHGSNRASVDGKRVRIPEVVVTKSRITETVTPFNASPSVTSSISPVTSNFSAPSFASSSSSASDIRLSAVKRAQEHTKNSQLLESYDNKIAQKQTNRRLLLTTCPVNMKSMIERELRKLPILISSKTMQCMIVNAQSIGNEEAIREWNHVHAHMQQRYGHMKNLSSTMIVKARNELEEIRLVDVITTLWPRQASNRNLPDHLRQQSHPVQELYYALQAVEQIDANGVLQKILHRARHANLFRHYQIATAALSTSRTRSQKHLRDRTEPAAIEQQLFQNLYPEHANLNNSHTNIESREAWNLLHRRLERGRRWYHLCNGRTDLNEGILALIPNTIPNDWVEMELSFEELNFWRTLILMYNPSTLNCGKSVLRSQTIRTEAHTD
ncbi:hypothetical protein F5884DRAFT_750721 [Xylogone sp. PMI_703]|nr:hypothetical protein F5884DRAFT_750721 [Xylogone sp. PMI_703]